MKRTLVLFVALVTLLSMAAVGSAQEIDRPERALPDHVADLKLDNPVSASGVTAADKIDLGLFGAEGRVRVSIRLTGDPVAAVAATGARADLQKIQLRAVLDQQAQFTTALRGQGGTVLGSAQVALNTVFAEVDASALQALAANPNVASISRVKDFEIDLSETVPYIGATAVQTLGFDGTGVTVAVLDSGIDYIHANLGGSGDPAEYAANDPTIVEVGTFPTAKVIGGHDFVGAAWLGSGGPAESPDPDPLDDGPGGGHGTHVADIIGGLGGVAPGVGLYAVKVCSSVSTACSGIALIQGMDFALDPNMDGAVDDHVDVINMSLGSDYGQAFDDDLSQAVEAATRVGVLTVASAGNGADKPYVVGTPSATSSALSVAQTNVPSAVQPLLEITAPAAIVGQYPAVFQDWSVPLETTGKIEGFVQYADGAGGNLNGCAPFAPGSLAGKIVLVDRGACNFTLKISNISQAGGLAGIIGLIAPGDPFNGGDGGDRPIDIPGFMVSQAISNALKSGLPNTYVVFDPANGIPLIQHMVGSSSRGPSMITNLIKPEIGAPGASVSAIYGTGTGTGPFGGTSGAAPMVSGSAALLVQAYPGRSPAEIKAVLMNTAETDIMNMAAFFGGGLAPISRIGGGEVRVDEALTSEAAAWETRTLSGALSFGFIDVWGTKRFTKRVTITNYSDAEITYAIASDFRFADDEASGAVTLKHPAKIKVPAHGSRTFRVSLTIDGSLLPTNNMNSGANGANPAALTLNEYDGYLTFTSSEGSLHMPWHVLPRQAAREIAGPMTFAAGMATVDLNNIGAGWAQNDAYTLIATSPDIPSGPAGGQAPVPDIEAVGVTTYPVMDYCDAGLSFVWAFAITSHERQSHLLPVSYWLYLDTNMDGTDDYLVTTADAAGPWGVSDGRQLTWTIDLATGAADAWFYAEHATNTANTSLWLCGEQIGMNGADMAYFGAGTNVGLDVYAADIYYGGPGDLVSDLVVTPYGEGYYGVPSDVAPLSAGSLTAYDFGLWPGNTPELGILLFSNGDRGAGLRGGATKGTESILLLPTP
ncbi:MAG: S8 family serine peptidase [Acidimicrobiia bacterium]|nr:S8 family serine peptidase [Acidimicrobiia bacterium]